MMQRKDRNGGAGAKAGLLAAVALACAPAPTVRLAWDPPLDGDATTPEEPAARVEKAEPTRNALRMHAWFVEVEGMRDEVVAGDREALASAAARLVQRLTAAQEVPETWRLHVEQLHASARRLADPARSLAEAAAALATLTGSCGACHEANGVVEAVEGQLPDDGDPPSGRSQHDIMRQHRWAAARMWEGLVVPSTRRWVRGTKAFLLVPDCPVDDATTEPAARCTHVRAVARRAHLAETRRPQVELYGELLATCAGCHATTELVGRAPQ